MVDNLRKKKIKTAARMKSFKMTFFGTAYGLFFLHMALLFFSENKTENVLEETTLLDCLKVMTFYIVPAFICAFLNVMRGKYTKHIYFKMMIKEISKTISNTKDGLELRYLQIDLTYYRYLLNKSKKKRA